jgi:hypothetical protein
MNGYEITLKFKLFTPVELDSPTFNEFLNLFREAFQQATDVQGNYIPLPKEYTQKILQQVESRIDLDWPEAEVQAASRDPEERIPVMHPWDQGLWFFPENHPLAPYERHAKRHYDGGVTTHKASPEEITQRAIEMGYKELPNGEG